MTKVKGPWGLTQINHYLADTTVPIRLAALARDGFPRVISLWYHYQDNALYCVSHRSSSLITLLEANPNVGFEVAPDQPPYYGVRGTADVQLLRDDAADDLLQTLLQRYLGDRPSKLRHWLLGRSAEEVVIKLTPKTYFCWDYRQRMSDVAPAVEAPMT
jgi:nitroimidazol reductase NimA-like FMN-containing flavoprotein (pyridoxamine 5'-phosphate oxidase superfamily)